MKQHTQIPESAARARLFEQLTPEQTQSVWTQLVPVQKMLNKGDLLIADGDTVNTCAIVESGSLSANKLYANGVQSLMLKFKPSFTVGADIAATKTKIATYYVTALTNTVVWVFDYEKLSKPGCIPENLRLPMLDSVLALIAGENLRKMNKIEILSRSGLRDRILTFLALESSYHRSRSFTIDYNREELADFLSVNRSRLSHELSLMQQEGLITFHKNKFSVHTPLYERGHTNLAAELD